MENRNTFIAIALMLLVWIAFTIMYPATPHQGTPQTAPVTSAPVATAQPAAPALTAPEVPSPVSAARPEAAELREVTIDTELYQAVVTTAGARLKSFKLKQYATTAAADALPVELVTTSTGTLGVTGSGDLAVPENAHFYTSDKRSAVQLSGDEQYSLRMELPLASGAVLVREFTFTGNKYQVELALGAANPTAAPLQGQLTLELLENTERIKDGGATDFSGSETFDGKKLQRAKLSALDKGDKEYASFAWSAYKSKYFLRAVAPLEAAADKVTVHKGGTAVTHRFLGNPLDLAAGAQGVSRYLLYMGPLDMEVLKQTGHNLQEAVDLGWFAWLARPLFHVLKFFHSYVGNYGWSIIILTILIKLVFWPLTDKSYASMKAMQKLQPHMQKLREKHKNDRERMNLEIMNLYKEHRVNPLGGCLPMLIQMPIFFALYQVLMNMIELRHAPFIFWITDLSAKDPYYVTPLIMGATMFIQQKLTPSQLDPVQQKIFLIMPVVFTFLFLTFPSGLVIYWMVSNLLTILQQVMINRRAD